MVQCFNCQERAVQKVISILSFKNINTLGVLLFEQMVTCTTIILERNHIIGMV